MPQRFQDSSQRYRSTPGPQSVFLGQFQFQRRARLNARSAWLRPMRSARAILAQVSSSSNTTASSRRAASRISERPNPTVSAVRSDPDKTGFASSVFLLLVVSFTHYPSFLFIFSRQCLSALTKSDKDKDVL